MLVILAEPPWNPSQGQRKGFARAGDKALIYNIYLQSRSNAENSHAGVLSTNKPALRETIFANGKTLLPSDGNMPI